MVSTQRVGCARFRLGESSPWSGSARSSHRRVAPSLQALIKLERLEHLHADQVVAE